MLENNFLTTVLLPAYLFVMMVGLGMSLVPADFTRLVEQPRAVLAGLAGQVLLLPLLAFALAVSLVDDPALAVGVAILGACPGGITSNLCVHLARGDTALSVTLTGLSSLLAMFTLPLIVALTLDVLQGQSSPVSVPVLRTVGQVFVITVLPIGIGMLLRQRWPWAYRSIEWLLELLLSAFLLLLVLVIVVVEWPLISDHLPILGGVLLLLNVLSLGGGLLLGHLLGLDVRQCTAVALEMGIQNGALGMVVAITVLGNVAYAIASGLYAVMMLLTALLFIVLRRRCQPED